MNFRGLWCCAFLLAIVVFSAEVRQAQAQAHSSSSPANPVRRSAPSPGSSIDVGAVVDGIYRNKSFGFTCKIPAGWVLRTDEMNAEDENQDQAANNPNPDNQAQPPTPRRDTKDTPASSQNARGRVLLAAFSRPPEARGEEVNSSIVIAAEPVATYPGLKEAAQYFGPLTEVATAQGFTVDEEPYEIAIGKKTLVRGDFHKDVGTRVMRQSTLVMLAHGFAVSITLIAGTEDDVEDLIDGLDFTANKK